MYLLYIPFLEVINVINCAASLLYFSLDSRSLTQPPPGELQYRRLNNKKLKSTLYLKMEFHVLFCFKFYFIVIYLSNFYQQCFVLPNNCILMFCSVCHPLVSCLSVSWVAKNRIYSNSG